MARVFITGSNDGLGRDAARRLVDQGHAVVGHARSEAKAASLREQVPGVDDVLVADLASAAQVRQLAADANALGRFDAVIHNAGVYLVPGREPTEDGHATVLAVNVLAPYVLTALMERPDRLVYVSSGLHQGGGTDLSDIDWTARPWSSGRAYSESKLYVSTLAAAVARHWGNVLSNSISPGWVATKMGGPGATDDLAAGSETQAWLAVSGDLEARVSGRYLFHKQQAQTHPAVTDPHFQDELLGVLERLTGVALPAA